MSRSRRNRDKKKRSSVALSSEELANRDKKNSIVIAIVLLALGAYLSVLFFAFQPVPNPDFTSFAQLGHELLSFQKPTEFKRAPVFGVLVAAMSYIVGGQHPDLTAGWMLNAILFPFCIVLLWQVAKRFVGGAGVWIALIAMANPILLTLLSEPIAEITLLFFVLLTFYFIFKGSRWGYFFASITMMVRYEGAALILAAFVMDMINRPGKKEKLKSLLFAAIASIPLIVWLMCTFLSDREMGRTHYLKEMGEGGAFYVTFVKYLHLMWSVSVGSLLSLRLDASQGLSNTFVVISKIVLTLSFLFGCVWGMIKRQWKILALLIFFVPYYLVHVLHSFVLSRFCVIVFWIITIVSLYGLQSIWKLIKFPKPAVVLIQIVLLITVLIWVTGIIEFIPGVVQYSPRTTSLPYVFGAAICILFITRMVVYKCENALAGVLIVAVMGLMVISSQFSAATALGRGQKHMEFKMLADWYADNAGTGEKMVSALPNVLDIFAPKHKGAFVHLGSIKAESPEDFAKKCYKRGITYVTWDAVGGRQVGGRYYKLWGFKNIAVLGSARDIGPYEFVTQIKANDRQIINVFRLRKINSEK